MPDRHEMGLDFSLKILLNAQNFSSPSGFLKATVLWRCICFFYLAAIFENPNDAGDAFAIEDAKAKQRSNVSYA